MALNYFHILGTYNIKESTIRSFNISQIYRNRMHIPSSGSSNSIQGLTIRYQNIMHYSLESLFYLLTCIAYKDDEYLQNTCRLLISTTK
jgi:hypothetical protein